MAALSDRGIRPRLDSYITTKQPQDLPSLLPSALVMPATAGSSASTYNLPLITSLVVSQLNLHNLFEQSHNIEKLFHTYACFCWSRHLTDCTSMFDTGLCRCSSNRAAAGQDPAAELSCHGHLQAASGVIRLGGPLPPIQRDGQSAQISQQVVQCAFVMQLYCSIPPTIQP